MLNTVKFEISLILPILILFGLSLIYLLVSAQNKKSNSISTQCFIYSLPVFAFAAGWPLSLFNIQNFLFSEAIVFDGLSIWSFLILLHITFLTFAFSSENPGTNQKRFPEFAFLLLNACIGMTIIAWSNDLIVTFIGIEMASLCLYILIALSSEKILSKEAAFKYFVLSSFASAFLLFGISFIYGSTETTYLNHLIHIVPQLIFSNRLLLFGLGLVILGLCFKVAIFPFHAWAPDVYQGAPTPITGFMAAGIKVSIFVVFLRLVGKGLLNGERLENLIEVIKWGSVLTLLAGNILALLQKNLKRMLAYSSISHAGFILIALIAAGIAKESLSSASSLLYYLFAYSIITMGIFGTLSLFEKKSDSIIHIEDLKGLSSKHPWVALFMSIFLISLAGLPPTIGFSAKLFVFYAALNESLFWVSLWALISTLIGIYYYLRPVILMYKKETETTVLEISSSKKLTHFFILFSALLTVFLSIGIEPFYRAMIQSLKDIFN